MCCLFSGCISKGLGVQTQGPGSRLRLKSMTMQPAHQMASAFRLQELPWRDTWRDAWRDPSSEHTTHVPMVVGRDIEPHLHSALHPWDRLWGRRGAGILDICPLRHVCFRPGLAWNQCMLRSVEHRDWTIQDYTGTQAWKDWNDTSRSRTADQSQAGRFLARPMHLHRCLVCQQSFCEWQQHRGPLAFCPWLSPHALFPGFRSVGLAQHFAPAILVQIPQASSLSSHHAALDQWSGTSSRGNGQCCGQVLQCGACVALSSVEPQSCLGILHVLDLVRSHGAFWLQLAALWLACAEKSLVVHHHSQAPPRSPLERHKEPRCHDIHLGHTLEASDVSDVSDVKWSCSYRAWSRCLQPNGPNLEGQSPRHQRWPAERIGPGSPQTRHDRDPKSNLEPWGARTLHFAFGRTHCHGSGPSSRLLWGSSQDCSTV